MACGSVVSLGFVIPPKKLYSLLRVLREHNVEERAPKSGFGRVRRPSAIIRDESPPPRMELPDPADDARYDMDYCSVVDLCNRMQDAIILADSEVPDSENYPGFLLNEVISVMVVWDEQAGNTVACYYSGTFGDEPDARREYSLWQEGFPSDAYEPRSVCMGKTVSERVLRGIQEGMGETLRKALFLQEAGIEVEDQVILLAVTA